MCAKKFLDKKIGSKYFKINKNLFFENTKEKKIARIKNQECDFFIDDLEKVLSDKKFPNDTEGLFFNEKRNKNFKNFSNWNELIIFFKKKLAEKNNFNGKNNECFTIKNKSIFVKKFNNNFKKELKFHKFLSKNNIKNIAQIVSTSNKRKLIKYKFYKNLKKKVITKKIILNVFKFIKNINKLNYSKEKFKYAKDYSRNITDYKKELKERIFFKKKSLEYKKNSKFRKLINKIEINFINLEKNNYFKNKYLFKNNQIILSPCDFHFENIIFYKKVIFIDFEYSGLDDPAKLFSVFFLQPNHLIKKKLFLTCIDKILFFKKNNLIKKRILFLMPIIYLRWALILLNNFSTKQLNKSIQYLHQRKEYYNLYKNYLS